MAGLGATDAIVSKVGIITLMPTRGTLTLETHEALSRNFDGLPNIRITLARKPIDEARNALSAAALRCAADDPMHIGSDNYYCLWVDDDAWWPAGTISRMVALIKGHQGLDLIGGYFCARQPFSPPSAFRKQDLDITRKSGEFVSKLRGVLLPVTQYGQNEVVPVDAVGAHFLMHRATLLGDIPANQWSVRGASSEDVSFCEVLREHGKRVAIATGIPVAHIDASTGLAFLPQCRPLRVVNGRLTLDSDPGSKSDEEVIAEWGASAAQNDRAYSTTIDATRVSIEALLKDEETLFISTPDGAGKIVMAKAELERMLADRRVYSSAEGVSAAT